MKINLIQGLFRKSVINDGNAGAANAAYNAKNKPNTVLNILLLFTTFKPSVTTLLNSSERSINIK
jgi:hypothetical protein